MTPIDEQSLEQQTGAFVERIFGSLIGALDLYVIDIGVRLGLYEALSSSAATSAELAERVGCAERYVREWLEQQAVSGIIEVAEAAADSANRRYTLPPAHREPLLNPDSPAFVGALANCASELSRAVPWLTAAFRTGTGIPLERYGESFVRLQAAITRPLYTHSLTGEWLPALCDLDERLRGDPPARVADLACGVGLAAVALATRYPTVTVDGLDNDETSIAIARRNAADAGVADRVTYHVADLSDGSRRLRPGDDLRGGPRHATTGRSVANGQSHARGRWAADRRRRANRGQLRGAGSDRRVPLRGQRAGLPAAVAGRAAVRRHRHRHSPGHDDLTCRRGRLLRHARPAGRERLLAVLRARRLIARRHNRGVEGPWAGTHGPLVRFGRAQLRAARGHQRSSWRGGFPDGGGDVP
ncbi:MAG: methyltransferase domain-containing protein [Pseudonocardiaceae bacterium]|nr:methyltransferase domain-containing protein [Pseudonocardiaceae bacterium]